MTHNIPARVGGAPFICCKLKLGNEKKFSSTILPYAAVQSSHFSPYSFLVSHKLFKFLTFAYQTRPELQLL